MEETGIKQLDVLCTERNIIVKMSDYKEFMKPSKSNLILPESVDVFDSIRTMGVKDHPIQGTVMAVGPKCEIAKVGMTAYIKYPQIFRTQHINAEDKVITNPIGMQLDLDGEEYRHMGEYEVLCFRNKK